LRSQLECGSFIHNSILLRHMQGKKLLINTMLKAKLIERDISELGPIITANSFQVVGMLIVQPQSQAPKVFKHFILMFQEENPRVTRIIINDEKNIPLAAYGANQEGPIVFIWSNYPDCSIITVLTREWDAAIIVL
jgi:hypothetical protein